MIEIQIFETQKQHPVSDKLFGIFLEDINFACDGGLNANVLNNHSFDGYYPQKDLTFSKAVLFAKPLKPVYDRLRYWEIEGRVESSHEEPLHENSWYALLHGNTKLTNLGYNGSKEYAGRCAISIKQGHIYDFSGFAKSFSFEGMLTVYAEDENGKKITEAVSFTPETEWSKHELHLLATKTAYGRFVIESKGNGACGIDCLSFMDSDYWGKGNPKWSQGKLRKDMVQMLADLKPRFMRFPGGALTQGTYNDTEYRWKDTVVPIEERTTKINTPFGLYQNDYLQSFQVGFYEYFLLCEDLGMEPFPVLWAGCYGVDQYTGKRKCGVPFDTKRYEEDVIQNALDLVEYANGDPAVSKWAKLRSDAGHPEPFGLTILGIGNENTGKYYTESFKRVYDIFQEKYPKIKLVMATGAFFGSKSYQKEWDAAKEMHLNVLMDEHFYKKPKWYFANSTLYDGYDRNGPHVLIGEHAANSSMFGMAKHPNNFESALSEAALLTGIERNSDVVEMTCYAPLFNKIGCTQWKHNLIDFNSQTVLHTGNYLVQKMYSCNMGTDVVKVSATKKGNLYLSATANAEKVIIKLVNNERKPAQIMLSFEQLKCAVAEIEYIHSANLKLQNELSFDGEAIEPITIKYKSATIADGKLRLDMEASSFYVISVPLEI